jgi:hypothetical protein
MDIATRLVGNAAVLCISIKYVAQIVHDVLDLVLYFTHMVIPTLNVGIEIIRFMYT